MHLKSLTVAHCYLYFKNFNIKILSCSALIFVGFCYLLSCTLQYMCALHLAVFGAVME
jgi:hypothetical protein